MVDLSFVPDNYRRDTPEDTIRVLLESQANARKKISELGAKNVSELPNVPKRFKRDTIEGTISALTESFRQAERKLSEQGSENGRLRKIIIHIENAVPVGLRRPGGVIASVEALAEVAEAAIARASELVAENTALKVRVDQLEAVQTDAALLAVMAQEVAA